MAELRQHERVAVARLHALASRTNAALPRLSRVVTGLERKGLVERVACAEDGRATHAVLTQAGERAYEDGRPGYDRAARRLVLDGIDDDGVDRLAELTLAILTRLDPERRLAVTTGAHDGPCAADPAGAPTSDRHPIPHTTTTPLPPITPASRSRCAWTISSRW